MGADLGPLTPVTQTDPSMVPTGTGVMPTTPTAPTTGVTQQPGGTTTPPVTTDTGGAAGSGAMDDPILGVGGDTGTDPGDTGGGTTDPAGGDQGGDTGGGSGAGTQTGGTCCSDGDCVCHGPDPSALTSSNGPFAYDSYRGSTGTIFYPRDAEPPFSAIAICPGFLNSGPEMEPWGPFYASHGFVMIATDTIGSDIPNIRAIKLLAAIDELKAENEDSSSPLFGKLAGRYGTSGYSMGGGGTTIASGEDPTLYTSIGLAAWGPVTTGVTVPTLLLCGSSDTVAPCSMSQGAYGGLPNTTPKMMITISGATHFNWFSPTAAGSGVSGSYALAFQKVYLDGDERWKSLLTTSPSRGTATTNIQ